MAQSIKTNYIYNLINTFSGLLFQLISFPYVSRVLLPDGVGHIDFYHSIIQYVTLLSSLGIPMYSIREIARVRGNDDLRNKTALEILSLHLILTLVGYLIVFVLSFTVAEIKQDIPLFLILSLSIIFSTIGCEWFYKGIEEFKYITIRGVIIRLSSLVLLFIFVREKDDLYYYACLLVFGTVGNNVLNFIRLRRHINISHAVFLDFRPFRHLIPVLRIFALNLIVSIYVQLNTVMLGFMSDDRAVGLFSSASRLSHFLLTFGTALGNAMLPRMSNLIQENKMDQFKAYADKSMLYMVAISLPLSVGLALTAPVLIVVFCGQAFYSAAATLQLLSPIVVMISMSNVLGIQIFYPMGKEKLVILCTGLGALVNLLLNFILIPVFDYNGAAVSTTIAEISVTLCMIIVGKKYYSVNLFNRSYVCYVVSVIIMGIVVYPIIRISDGGILSFVFAVSVGAVIYATCLLFMKESLTREVLMIVKSKLKSGK